MSHSPPVAQVGFETEGTAIYDTMCYVNNEVHTVGVGAAMGQACMLLSAGHKGKRFMQPNATGEACMLRSAGHQEALLHCCCRLGPGQRHTQGTAVLVLLPLSALTCHSKGLL